MICLLIASMYYCELHTLSSSILSNMNTVTATLVSKANASNDQEELQDAVSQALIVGFFISLVGSTLMMAYPQKILSSILKGMMIMKSLKR